MPHYTTSYSTKNKPRARRAVGSQLPQARQRQRRKGAQYLKRSQGFGGRRRAGSGYAGGGRNDRRAYALIIVGCAFLLFVASILWYANRNVEITLNGTPTKVRIHSTVERVIVDQGLEPSSGNLLAVDGEILKKGAGTPYTATLNGKKLSAQKSAELELEGGEDLAIEDGVDLFEDHDVAVTQIQPTITVEGTGSVQYVKTWGKMGRSEVWTGRVTGKVSDKGVVQEPVNAVVECASVLPRKKDKKYVALTFDEGPSSATQRVVEILKEKDAKATFFISGDRVASNKQVVRSIAESGNELGTNAYSDVNLSELPADELRSQLANGFEAVQEATGSAVTLVRPPFGAFSDQNWADAMDLVSAVVTWNVDSGDWLLQGASSVVDTVTSSVSNGDIVLLTDNDSTADQTVEALPLLIDALREQGYELVTISELIATDSDLKDLVKIGKAGLPKGASLPVLPDSGEDEQSE